MALRSEKSELSKLDARSGIRDEHRMGHSSRQGGFPEENKTSIGSKIQVDRTSSLASPLRRKTGYEKKIPLRISKAKLFRAFIWNEHRQDRPVPNLEQVAIPYHGPLLSVRCNSDFRLLPFSHRFEKEAEGIVCLVDTLDMDVIYRFEAAFFLVKPGRAYHIIRSTISGRFANRP